MTSAAEFQAKVTKSVADFDKLDGIVNGGPTATVETDHGTVPSFAKAIGDFQTSAGAALTGIGNVAAAVTATGEDRAQTAVDRVAVEGAVAAATPPANNDSLREIRPYLIERLPNQDSIRARNDGRWDRLTATAYLQFLVPLTAEQIAAGKVTVDVGGVFTVANVTQQNSSGTQTVAAAALSVVGSRRQSQITLNGSTTQLLIDLQSTSSDPLGSPSVTLGPPVEVPDTGDYYGAFGRQAAVQDGVLLAPLIAAVDTISGSASTLNSDGTMTVPSQSNGAATILFDPAVVVKSADTIYLVLEPLSGGPLRAGDTSVKLYGGNNHSSAAFVIQETIGVKPFWVVAIPAGIGTAGAGSNVPVSAVFSVGNIKYRGGASTPLTVRCSAYLNKLPFMPAVPSTITKAINAAKQTAPVKAVTATGVARVDRQAGAHTVRVDPSDFKMEAAQSELMLAMLRVASGKAVSTGGSDGAAGTVTAPYATVAAAFAAMPSGGTIGVRNGQVHRIDASTVYDRLTYEFVGYGFADAPAILDFRQHVTGAWTATGDGGWTRTITHRQPLVNADSEVNTFALYNGMSRQQWIWAGSITANKAAAKAAGNAFCVNKTGSTNGDPLADAAGGTSFVYTWYPAVAVDPATLDMSILDVEYFGMGPCSNVTTFGLAGKDHSHTDASAGTLLTDYPLPVLHNKTSLDVNIHGHVGPCCTTGTFTVTGKGRQGRTGGLEMFPGGHPNQDSTHDVIYSEDSGYAVYVHGTNAPVNTFSTYFFRNLLIKRLEGPRNGTAIEVWRSTTGGVGSACSGVIRIGEVYLLDQRGPLMHGEAVGGCFVDSGYVEYLNPIENCSLVVPAGTPVVLSCTVYCAPGKAIAIANGDAASSAYPITFKNFVDASAPADGLRLFGNGALNQQDLIFDNAQMWDIQRSAGLFPKSLTVLAGSRFGFGGRTRAEIRDLFAANSVTCTISDNTTIVNANGNVIEGPVV